MLKFCGSVFQVFVEIEVIQVPAQTPVFHPLLDGAAYRKRPRILIALAEFVFQGAEIARFVVEILVDVGAVIDVDVFFRFIVVSRIFELGFGFVDVVVFEITHRGKAVSPLRSTRCFARFLGAQGLGVKRFPACMSCEPAKWRTLMFHA
jgi:hypothetical protein